MRGHKRKLASSQADAPRQLRELRGVGAATLRDLTRLGVTSVEQLALQSHTALYARLNEHYKAARARGEYAGVAGLGPELDACVLDTLECAIAQARNRALPPEECNWWWYSRRRKAAQAAAKVAGGPRQAKRPQVSVDKEAGVVH